ncbi:MAG: CvpA family protein [Bacteroidetes bacterium]|nr:CvpA family protein [Bacteroidota bacterium]
MERQSQQWLNHSWLSFYRMILDAIILILGLLAFIRGWKKGLLWALGSLVAVFAGIFISLKLSHTLADFLFKHQVLSGSYTLLLCFVVLFLLTMLAFRMLVGLVESILDKVMLGWVNHIGGGLLYTFFVVFVISTFLWLAKSAGLLQENIKSDSKTYVWIEPIGPKTVELVSAYLPFCKSLWADITSYTSAQQESNKSLK